MRATGRLRVEAAALADSARLNVDLRTLTGTGRDGMVTAADVRQAAEHREVHSAPLGAAAPPPTPQEGLPPMTTTAATPRPHEAAVRPRPSLMVEKRSQWRPWGRMAGQRHREMAPMVKVDVYGRNPLVQELQEADPAQYQRSLAEFGPPPTLFNAGHAPLYLASGVEVTLLEQLPWIARPAAARAVGAEFAEILDRFGAPTQETWEDADGYFGLDTAVQRYRMKVQDWGITDPNDRVRNHLPASARLELPTNNDGLSW